MKSMLPKPQARRSDHGWLQVLASIAFGCLIISDGRAAPLERCVTACAQEIQACVATCGDFGAADAFRRACRRAVLKRCRGEGVGTCAGRSYSGIQIESFDSAAGWERAGNSSSQIDVDRLDKQEGASSLVWTSTVNEQITKHFARPLDLGDAAEFRLWLRANRTVGSACCGFSMRLVSSSGYFERHILPDVPPGMWVEDVSERDAWVAVATSGEPSWDDIRGLEYLFYGDFDVTRIQLDDLRALSESSTAPAARRSAGVVTQEATGPLFSGFHWLSAPQATTADGSAASVMLEDDGQFGFVASTYLNARDFGFSVPVGASIRGIRVELRVRQEGFLVWDWEVRLLRDGTRVGSDGSLSDTFPESFAYRYFGGPTDLWDVGLRPSDVNDPGFGVSIAVGTHSPPVTAFVDDVRIGVYYTVP
jgi:hypothetical protein